MVRLAEQAVVLFTEPGIELLQRTVFFFLESWFVLREPVLGLRESLLHLGGNDQKVGPSPTA
ncbi:MAG: hypothetical protein VXY07_17380, partial [Planctomycetota bacterium]|nr:hypothetical protein [Planctomycetota bacterium]